jgi:hypothetical protein
MPPAAEKSTKTKLINRAKALAALSLPVLVLAGVVALYLAIEGRQHGVPTSTVEKSETLSATSADAKVDMERRAEGATTVTTYTITGRY